MIAEVARGEGGDGGGTVVAEGTPEEIARASGSHTGAFLDRMLADDALASEAAD